MNAYIAEYGATPARRRSLIVVLANFVFFSALLAVMFYVRNHTADWPVPFGFGNLLMIFAMSMGAICGSITIAVSAHSASLGKTDEATRWMAIAIASWLVFLFLELVEWVWLVLLVGLGPKTPFGATFLVLTGTHWLAVIVCVCWLTWIATGILRHDILAAGTFSHFLALWYIVLVVTLYLTNVNPLEGL